MTAQLSCVLWLWTSQNPKIQVWARAAVIVRHVWGAVCFKAHLSVCWQDLVFCRLLTDGFPQFLAKWPLHEGAYLMSQQQLEGNWVS